MQSYSIPSILNESIYFDYAPPPTLAGHINRYPFRIVISSSNDDDHYVFLDSKYSRSYHPQDILNKWSFLRSEFRFLDLSGNKISAIKTIDTPLYLDKNGLVSTVTGNFIGVSGYAEFYFVDDWYNFDLAMDNGPYTCIVATLQTSAINYYDPNLNYIGASKESNSFAVAIQPHIFHYRPPEYIKISENGIRDFINPRWIAATQPIVYTLNWNSKYDYYIPSGNQITPINTHSNFCKTHPFSESDNTIAINTDIVLLSGTHFIKTTAVSAIFLNDLNIYYNDENGYLTTGYNKNHFDFYMKTTLGCAITASTSLSTPNLFGNDYSPKLWISNPNAGCVSIVEYNSQYSFLEDSRNLLKAQIYNFDVPVINQDFLAGTYATSGHHDINSIAVLPFPEFNAWACDGDLNYLYKFATNGQILCAIDIYSVTGLPKTTSRQYETLPYPSPASISLDGNKNIWMTLYDTTSVLKFDAEGNYLNTIDTNLFINYQDPPNIDLNWYKDNFDYPNTITENLIQPTFIETDIDNNIWVSYSNYASGILIKFDTDGNLLNTITYDPESCPQDIIVDSENNVWIALSNTIWDTDGYIEKRNTDGILLSSFGPIKGVNNLALDINQNLWYTFGYNEIGYLNNQNARNVTFSLSSYTDASLGVDSYLTTPSKNTSETAIEGIACDLKGNIYVINSIENQIYVFDSKIVDFSEKFYINPQGFTFYTNGEYTRTLKEYNQWQKSAQAYGDWTGFKWLNKYVYRANYNSSTLFLNLSGVSRTLDVFQSNSSSLQQSQSLLVTNYNRLIETNYGLDITVDNVLSPVPLYLDNKIDLFKINENFDFAAQIKSFSFIPSLYESEVLLNSFIPSIFGTYPFSHFDLGIFPYEKISNFIKNTKDIDTANINHVYDMSDILDENTNDYRINYPSNTKRIMDLVSINQSRLWGSSAMNQNNFINQSNEGVLNKGKLLTINYQVSAGTPVVLKTKSLNKYELIQTGPLFQLPPDKITISLDNFRNIILDNTNTPKTSPSGNITDSSYQIASQKILYFKPQIQQQIVDYADYYFPAALDKNGANLLKCKRDIGLMIDALANDLSSGVVSRTIQYALAYWEGSTSRLPENLIPNQIQNTTDTIAELRNYIENLCQTNIQDFSQTQYDEIKNSLQNFINIILDQNNVPVTTPSGIVSDDSYANASNAILQFKSQLQQQIVDYVYYQYPTTLSNSTLSAKCYRDTGYIIDAIAADIANNANHRSIEVGNIYFKGTLMGLPNYDSSVPTLPSDQILVTIDAISMLKNYINGTNIPTGIPSFTYTGILSSGNLINRQTDLSNRVDDVVYPLQNNGQLNSYVPAGSPTQQDIETSQFLIQNRAAIQNYMSAYVVQSGYLQDDPLFPTLSAKCYRDVGFILDAIAADIANNANHRSIDVSYIYFNGTLGTQLTYPDSSIPSLPSDQITATIAAISAINFYITGKGIPEYPTPFTTTGVLSGDDMVNRAQDVTYRLKDIIYTLENNGQTKVYLPQGNPLKNDIQLGQELLTRKEEIQNAVADYVKVKQYLTKIYPDPVLTAKCNRDVGLMLDAVISDIRTGVVARSIEYALAYWEGSTSRLPETAIPNQKQKTIDTINYLKKTIINVLQKNSYNLSSIQKSKISNILENFNKIILSINNVPRTTPGGAINSDAYKNASANILKYKSNLQDQIVNFVKYNFPSVLTNTALSLKCYRDTGYIIDAIAADIANNTNHRSIEVGNLYFKGTLTKAPNYNSSVPTLPSDEVAPTIAAIQALGYYITGKDIPKNVPTFTLTGILSSTKMGSDRNQDVLNRIDDIIFPLQNQGALKPYIPNGYPKTEDRLLADAIDLNRDIIRQTVAQYVYDNDYLVTQYSVSPDASGALSAKCKRDVGYMVDAVANDLITGVNSRTIQYALAYWQGSTSRLPQNILPDQIKNTIDTINFLNNYLIKLDPRLLSYVGNNIKIMQYPLEELVIFLKLNQSTGSAWNDFYEFYEFIPGNDQKQIDGIIDWQNDLTTLNKNLSSYLQWVGNEQMIDRILSYDIYHGLGLL